MPPKKTISVQSSNAKWAIDFENMLLEGTKYSGSREPFQRVISASSLGKEPYYLMLVYLHGKADDQEKFGANTMGSIYQLGLDKLIENCDKENRYISAQRLKMTLENGWEVSGETDIYDTLENVIIDGKLLSGGGFESALKDEIDSDYNLQLAVYKLIVKKNKESQGEIIETPIGALHACNKAGSAIKNNIYSNFELTTYEPEEIHKMLLEKTNILEQHIQNNTMPEEICDVFKFGKTDGIPNRCRYYCDYNKVCPAYTKNEHLNTKKSLEALDVIQEKPSYFPNKNYDF